MQKVIEAIIGGTTQAQALLELLHKRTRIKYGDETIQAALTSIISKAERIMLRFSREETLMYERQIQECYQQMAFFKAILGIKEDSAMRIIEEIGTDMKAFLTASAIVGLAGLKSRNEESA